MGFLPIREFFRTDAANVGQVDMVFYLALDARGAVPLIQAPVPQLIGCRFGPREDSRGPKVGEIDRLSCTLAPVRVMLSGIPC